MNRRKIPDWLIVLAILGLGFVFFLIAYWPGHSAIDGVLGVLGAIVWFLMEWAVHSHDSHSEKERKNNFGLL
jgi:hypothetical protein